MKPQIPLVVKTAVSSLAIVLLFLFSTCRKEEPLPEYYIRCKIDGEDYWPNKCANYMRGQLLGDTVFMMNANAGYLSVSTGLHDLSGITRNSFPLVQKLDEKNNTLQYSKGGSGVYTNSIYTANEFRTDSVHVGELTILSLDKTNKIISGTFHFQAYNLLQK